MVEYITPDWVDTFKEVRGYYNVDAELQSNGYYNIHYLWNYNYSSPPAYSTENIFKIAQICFVVPNTVDEVHAKFGVNLFDYASGTSLGCSIELAYGVTDGYGHYYWVKVDGDSAGELIMDITPVYDTPLYLTLYHVGDKLFGYFNSTRIVDVATSSGDTLTLPYSDMFNNHWSLYTERSYIESISMWNDNIINPVYRPFRRFSIGYDYGIVPARVYVSQDVGTLITWSGVDSVMGIQLQEEINAGSKVSISLSTPAYHDSGAFRIGDRVKVSWKDRSSQNGSTAFIGIIPPEGITIGQDVTTIRAYDYVSLLNSSMLWKPNYNGYSVSGAITELVEGLSYPSTPHTDGLLKALVPPIEYSVEHDEYDGWVSRLTVIKDILKSIPLNVGLYGFTSTVINDTPYFRIVEISTDGSALLSLTKNELLAVKGERIYEFCNACYVEGSHIYYKNEDSIRRIGEYSTTIGSHDNADTDMLNAYNYVNLAMSNNHKVTISRPDLYNVSIGSVIELTDSGIGADGKYFVSEKSVKKSKEVDRTELVLTLPLSFFNFK